MPTDSHHTAHFCNINLQHDSIISSTIFKRNFSAANYDTIVSELCNANCDPALLDEDLDANVNNFYNILNNVITHHVPLVKSSPGSYPIWYNHDLIKNIQDKKRTHCRWKQTENLSDYIEFERLRAVCIRLSRFKYKTYICKVESGAKRNIRHFWTHVKNLEKVSSIPCNTFLNGNHASTDQETTNLFSLHFGSVYSRDNNSNNTNSLDYDQSDINIITPSIFRFCTLYCLKFKR